MVRALRLPFPSPLRLAAVALLVLGVAACGGD